LVGLAAVYSPLTDDQTLTLAPSGWTYHETNGAGVSLFVLYDKETGTLWYPFDDKGMRGIAGPLQDVLLTEIQKMSPTSFENWKSQHPTTFYVTD